MVPTDPALPGDKADVCQPPAVRSCPTSVSARCLPARLSSPAALSAPGSPALPTAGRTEAGWSVLRPSTLTPEHGQRRGPRTPAVGLSSGLSCLPAPHGQWRGSKGPQPPGHTQAPAAPRGHPLTFSPLSPSRPQAPFTPRSPCEDEERSQSPAKLVQVLSGRAPVGRGTNPPWGRACPGVPCPPSPPGLRESRRGQAGPVGEHTA